MANISTPVSQSTSDIKTRLASLQTALATANMHLTAGPAIPTIGLTQTQLQAMEPVVTGYTPAVCGPFSGPFQAQNGDPYIISTLARFVSADLVNAISISGGWVDNGATTGAAPVCVFVFNPPLTLGGPLDPTILATVEFTSVVGGQVEVAL